MSKWTMVRLGDVFEQQITGEWGEACDLACFGTPVLRTTNFTNLGEIDYTNIAIRKIPQNKIDKKRLQKGDIILEKSGGTENTPVGRVVFCDEAISESVYLCNNFTQAMRAKKNIVEAKYIFYYMFYLHKTGATDLMQNKTTGIRNLQIKRYLDTMLSLPPLYEQKKIAAELDKINDLIVKRKKQIEKLDLLVKSQFVEMFGDIKINDRSWDKKLIGDICEVGSSKRVFLEDLVEEGIPFYRGTEISSLSLGKAITPELFITKEHYAILCASSGAPIIGDLLLPSICYDGKIWRVDTNIPFYFKDGRVLWISNKDSKVNSIYLQYALKRKLICDYLNIASGTTFAELKIFTLKKVDILIPSIHLQNQFADFVAKVEQTKSNMQIALSKLETLYKARMQEYFN